MIVRDGPGPGQTTDRIERGSAGCPARKAKDETFCRLGARAIKKALQAASSGRSRVIFPANARLILPDWCDRAEDRCWKYRVDTICRADGRRKRR